MKEEKKVEKPTQVNCGIHLLPWEGSFFVGRLYQMKDKSFQLINVCQIFLGTNQQGQMIATAEYLGKTLLPDGTLTFLLDNKSIYYRAYAKVVGITLAKPRIVES